MSLLKQCEDDCNPKTHKALCGALRENVWAMLADRSELETKCEQLGLAFKHATFQRIWTCINKTPREQKETTKKGEKRKAEAPALADAAEGGDSRRKRTGIDGAADAADIVPLMDASASAIPKADAADIVPLVDASASAVPKADGRNEAETMEDSAEQAAGGRAAKAKKSARAAEKRAEAKKAAETAKVEDVEYDPEKEEEEEEEEEEDEEEKEETLTLDHEEVAPKAETLRKKPSEGTARRVLKRPASSMV